MSKASKGFILSGIIAVLNRLVIFTIAALYPITVDNGYVMSPFIAYGTDLPFYEQRKNEMFSGPANDIIDVSSIKRLEWRINAGPLFPTLLYLFRYESGNSWPLASLYLIGSICLVLLWLEWLYGQGISWIWLIVFALIPNPIYFMLSVGTDLPFSILCALFFFAYCKTRWTKKDVYIWMTALLLLPLTRPNGISMLLFVITDLVVRDRHQRSFKKMVFCLFLGVAVLMLGLFFGSYFLTVSKNALAKTFFGVPAYQFVEGVLPILPEWLDQICSLVLLLLAKILYFLGLRPSYSGVSLFYVVIRAVPGLVLLPGLVYLFWKGRARHKMLLAFFLLPILMVGAQDRYNMPIQPLLFFYGVKAFEGLGAYITTKGRYDH